MNNEQWIDFMHKSGLFVGLATLDFLYLTPQIPQVNEKRVAVDYTVAAGGPATNGAIAFEYLRQLHEKSGSTQLLASVGTHPLSTLIRADLEVYGVHCIDLDPQRPDPPPVSSILVTPPRGDRAVISINATHAQGAWKPSFSALLDDVQVVLIDGHQMAISQELAQVAKAQQIPIIIDGGSWKAGFERVLALADTAIAYYTQGKQAQIPVPQVSAVDTLGAGDIFHGAFCYYSLELDFVEALTQAAQIASASVQQFGTRAWMNGYDGEMGG